MQELRIPEQVKRAPLRVGPYRDGEPAYSLFERLARRAGVSAQEMARDYGLTWHKVRIGKATESVAAIADVDPARLRRSTVATLPGTMMLNGAAMERCLWDRTREHCCPECIRQDQLLYPEAAGFGIVRRVWWDCTAVAICHEHTVPLEPIPSNWSDDFRRSRVRNSPGSNDLDGSWEAYLVARLGFGPRISSEILDEMSVGDATLSVALFGWVSRFGKHIPYRQEAALSDPRTLYAGFEVLQNAASLSSFLDRIWIDTYIRKGGLGIEMVYGPIYIYYRSRQRFTKRYSKKHFESIIRRIRDHALSRLPLGSDPEIFGETFVSRGLRGIPVRSKMVYAREVAYFQLAVALGLLDPALADVRWRLIGVTSHTIEGVETFLASTVNAREMAQSLGISKTVFQRLVDEGVIIPRFSTGLGRSTVYYFDRGVDVDFIGKLAGSAPIVAEMPPGTISISDAAAAADLSLARLVRYLFDGKLRAAARLADGPLFPGILVALEDVVAFTRLGTSGSMLPFRDFAVRSGISYRSVRTLVKKGILRPVSIGRPSHRGNLWLPLAELERFDAEYVTGDTVAAALGIHSSELLRKLRSFGVDYSCSGHLRPLLLKRAEVEAAGLLAKRVAVL